jgi:hypothetical protein
MIQFPTLAGMTGFSVIASSAAGPFFVDVGAESEQR